MNSVPWVIIRCLTYNQEPYIRQCLDGFVMQKTTFPFIAVVHDDASADGTAVIVREYAEKYPDIIHPLFESENQYSKQDGSLRRIMDDACKNAKYIAVCEGDDYWTDPLKLQKQVDYMEEHEDCCMTACAADLEEDGKTIKNNRISEESRDLTTEEVILGGGGYLATASLVFNNDRLNKDIPKWRQIASVGDYPLQIQGTLAGRLHYFPEVMCVHRVGVKGSWTNTYLRGDKELTQIHRQKEVMWMKELDRDTNHKYQNAIYQHLKEYFPVLYRKRMASTRDYFRSVRVAGGHDDYRSMIKNIIKRVLNYRYNDM